ncbi:hypothetical protein FBUS_07750 [Fasciolopsis buskii]|uniref:N-acetyltransferase domain-containing protein n=1 Tax=Fasciolopsis buskii TaxID=27845 RepID=A0A8E0VJ87_9TREM|nr:hypothetical protein FBUS_07750 [Fasciolopsis buski]
MFHIRGLTPADSSDAHKLITSLYHHHAGLSYENLLSETEFADHLQGGYLRGLLLTYTETTQSSNDKNEATRRCRSIGILLYHSTVSNFYGKGIFVDQLFIEQEFRGRGLGRMMMARLCRIGVAEHAVHIKLVFQKGLPAEKFYERLGFKNRTAGSPRLHHFQAFGKSELKKVLDKGKILEQSVTGNVHPHALVKIVFPVGTSRDDKLSTWNALRAQPLHCHEDLHNALCPPDPQNVILTNEILGNSSGEGSKKDNSIEPAMCMFLEKIVVCSWVGPLVSFSEFMGNTALLRPEVLYNRLLHWSKIYPSLGGAIWEVPFEIEDKNIQQAGSLKSSLNLLNAVDGTEHEGWNICVLEAAEILRLAETAAGKNVDF